jgi:hypothetical protein
MADDKEPKAPKKPDNPDAELEGLQSKGLGGASAKNLDAGFAMQPPPGLDPGIMDKLQQMLMGPPGTPPGQLGAMNPFRYLGGNAYSGQGVNPMTGMPIPGGPMAQFQQGPQQPLPPQTGMPLPQ